MHSMCLYHKFLSLLLIRPFDDAFCNLADIRHLQISNTQTAYYEILPARHEKPHDITGKITTQYIEFKYHFRYFTKNPITLNKGV